MGQPVTQQSDLLGNHSISRSDHTGQSSVRPGRRSQSVSQPHQVHRVRHWRLDRGDLLQLTAPHRRGERSRNSGLDDLVKSLVLQSVFSLPLWLRLTHPH